MIASMIAAAVPVYAEESDSGPAVIDQDAMIQEIEEQAEKMKALADNNLKKQQEEIKERAERDKGEEGKFSLPQVEAPEVMVAPKEDDEKDKKEKESKAKKKDSEKKIEVYPLAE